VNVVETITALRAAGGSVTVSAGALIVDAPPALPVAVWDALTLHKATLVDLLTPTATYADLARHEEREAIQAENEAPAGAVFPFGRTAKEDPIVRTSRVAAGNGGGGGGDGLPARRGRLLRDAPGIDPHRGSVTFPAGLTGTIADDIDDIDDPLQRIHVRFLLQEERAAGRYPLIIFLDGRPRVLEADAVHVLDDGETK
jgi:hypothetical protein